MAFTKLALRREAMNAHRDTTATRKLREIPFSDLSPQEEKQLYVLRRIFYETIKHNSAFVVGGKGDNCGAACRSPTRFAGQREAVLLYYFFDMGEREIAK